VAAAVPRLWWRRTGTRACSSRAARRTAWSRATWCLA
jgi:hypothetical protein